MRSFRVVVAEAIGLPPGQRWRLAAGGPPGAPDAVDFDDGDGAADADLEGLPGDDAAPILIDGSQLDETRWHGLIARTASQRRQVLLFGVTDATFRARLLRFGFGDVVGPDIPPEEVAARAERIGAQTGWVERYRGHGAVRLDLLAREGFVGTRRLALQPREFQLLWRLMEVPGVPVDKRELLRDVWGLAHVPQTNSLAVHASRLRTKLAGVGLRGFIQTTAAGSYVLPPIRDGGEGLMPAKAPA